MKNSKTIHNFSGFANPNNGHHTLVTLALRSTFFMFTFLFTVTLNVYAQTNITDAYIKTADAGSGLVYCSYILFLNDTSNIDEIELKLATEKDGEDLIYCLYNYSQNSGLPNGLSFTRSGCKLTFSGTTFNQRNLYYGNVKLKTNGSWGSPFDFISN